MERLCLYYNDYTNGHDDRECEGLTSIRADIPADAVGVKITGNSIREVMISANSLSVQRGKKARHMHLTKRTWLSLVYNEIQEIQA